MTSAPWLGSLARALVLIALVTMLVHLPVLLGDVRPSGGTISWFVIGWIAARASALWVARRRRESRDGR